MSKINSHIVSHWKAYLRFLVAAIFPTILPYKFSGMYTLLILCIAFLMLIFELFRQNYPKNQIEAFAYYTLWISVFLCIILHQQPQYNYFDYEFSLLFLHYPIKEILILKLSVFVISLMRYKSILVTSTILSKLWLVIMFAHFSILFLNSTYSFGISAYYLAMITAIETILIIFSEEKLLVYKSSIFDFLWKKTNQK
ncbi:MAG: hypothetical protein AAF611_20425 [Bacteroidota bacterium]